MISHCDQGGRPDGVQVMVYKDHAYIGHMFSNGITILDIRDPYQPKPVAFVSMPPNTRSHHIQVADDLLLAINGPNIWALAQFQQQSNYFSNTLTDSLKGDEVSFSAGVRIYDVSVPASPREIAFLDMPGLGVNRIWWTGGRYAYVAAHLTGYRDHIMVVVDLADPIRPIVVAQWELLESAGNARQIPAPGQRFAAHHAIVAGDIAYTTWRDGGLTVHDISRPNVPRQLSHLNWSPPFTGGTHTALPLADRGLLVVLDEATTVDCANGVPNIWIMDIRLPEHPVMIATVPKPSEEEFCRKGGKFGPHNLHENRPGSFQSSNLIFATYLNAGLRVYDIADPYRPQEVGYFVPPPPTRMMDARPNAPRVIQSSDLFVEANGLIYMTDQNAGLYVLEYDP